MTTVYVLVAVWFASSLALAVAVGKALAWLDARPDLPGTRRVPRAEMPGHAHSPARRDLTPGRPAPTFRGQPRRQ
jgi:hypothetical protein